MIEISNNVTYCRRPEENEEYASHQVFSVSPQSAPIMVSTESPKQKLHISIHSVTDLDLHFKYSSSHKRKNGTEAKPNKKFITSKVLQQRSLYQFLVGDIDTNIRSTLKTGRSFVAQFLLSVFLSRFGGHGTRFMGKQKSTFYSTFFRYILWEKKHFFVAVRSYSIMFDTMHNKFAGSSFQFEIDTEEKSCSIDSCSEKRQFLIPFCAS